jgi:lipoyl(octanoyl) transferase
VLGVTYQKPTKLVPGVPPVSDTLPGFELLGWYGIQAQTRAGLTGVWVDDRKIASIGVGVRQWITMHGFALNVCGDLSAFAHIVPCGITNVTMTSIEKEADGAWTVEQVATRAGEVFARRLSELDAAIASPVIS